MHYNFSSPDGRKCQGANPLKKLHRIAMQKAGKGGEPTGHPTKKRTKYRVKYWEGADRVKKAKAKIRYENLIMELYERAQ